MRRVLKVLGIVLATLAIWIGVDLADSSRHDLRQFDGHEVGRLENTMWRAYYAHQSIRLFRDMMTLLHSQYHLNFWRSAIGAYRAAHAAIVFQPGKERADYMRALPDIEKYYDLIRHSSTTPFDVDRVSRAELEWWIIHRQRDRHPRGDLADSLADLQALIYGGNPSQYREHAEARAEAMLLRDERALANSVTDDDWRKIGELLDKSWTALEAELRKPVQ
jgi:hypothetical protein